MKSKWDELQDNLNMHFQEVNLLKQAFTHASYRNEHRKAQIQDNERLEFLGDAVLELLISDFLFQAYPHMPEGELTRMRAAIVCEPSLVMFAKRLQFDEYVRLGRGEERSGGRRRPALLADVFEAFLGALYIDQGIDRVREFVDTYIIPHLADAKVGVDYKTALQEWVQQRLGVSLRYVIVEERGPAHAREFVVHVAVGDTVMGIGAGKSKKEAEQQAAAAALKSFMESASEERDTSVSKTD
ncbi:ribonuclease III [Alicyclobacillus acidoterrestris]|uniref:Ribonuclease 3 n=1 Tax=Alicyclobacillus acidoterrestris (strain ATCC 49025 / DSM 3922 / CIP 106132 / NCIMB 13137 / GD3B) TaxID=1356854 RepID=T0DJX1_ALIAG|nr:ribonuclease III [Alicyclobacillus acidoterrestris]EPZ51587.1 ribonuclease III [Alicyclobacillus acidoterrestris ATCC 49025]UNO50644.1 ribonuclease III [Alicyclobacillus acidoterrestris]